MRDKEFEMQSNRIVADTANHDLQYIGAPGGEEWATPNTWEIDAGVFGIVRGIVYPIDYIDESIKSRQVINLIEPECNKQFQKELIYFDNFCIRANSGHYSEFYITTPKGSATLYSPKGEEPKTMDDLVDDYSKLSNISINKGQDEMFSFYSPYKDTTPNYTKQVAENIIGNKKDTYRPLPDCLTIKESSIDGLGVFATKNIDKDVALGITHHYIDAGFKDELIRTPLAGFLNHSNNPNATIEEFENGKGRDHTYKNYKMITIRPISAGEEITVDYTKELCGLSGYNVAEFLEDKLEDRVYENSLGVNYYYNETLGKYESDGFAPIDGNFYPIFFTPEDAEKFLKRVE